MPDVTNGEERAVRTSAMVTGGLGAVIIGADGSYDGTREMPPAAGVTSRSAGARALCVHLVTIPLRTRGVPRVHDGRESAIDTVSGETEEWHGEGLRRSVIGAVSGCSRRSPGRCQRAGSWSAVPAQGCIGSATAVFG